MIWCVSFLWRIFFLHNYIEIRFHAQLASDFLVLCWLVIVSKQLIYLCYGQTYFCKITAKLLAGKYSRVCYLLPSYPLTEVSLTTLYALLVKTLVGIYLMCPFCLQLYGRVKEDTSAFREILQVHTDEACVQVVQTAFSIFICSDSTWFKSL